MSCSAPERELVTFLLAATLDRADAEQLSRHLETCPDCRAVVEDGASVISGMRELHLRADEIVAAAAGDLTSPHLLVCGRCRDEVALLRTVNADLSARPRAAAWRWPAIAAAVAAAAVLTLWIAPRRAPDADPAVRGRAAEAVTLAPVTFGPSRMPTFTWTPVAAARRYRVSVFAENGLPVWTREADAPPLVWPDDPARTAGSYRWTVEALAGTTVIARSRIADFSLP